MPEPITRTILERFDLPDSNYETVIMLVELAPQVNTELHTHPAFDAAYCVEGDVKEDRNEQGNEFNCDWVHHVFCFRHERALASAAKPNALLRHQRGARQGR